MNHIEGKLREFGRRCGFIPSSEKYKIRDEFAYVDPNIKDLAYQVKEEIEDYYAKKKGVMPFHRKR